jgi:hypothetical protein
MWWSDGFLYQITINIFEHLHIPHSLKILHIYWILAITLSNLNIKKLDSKEHKKLAGENKFNKLLNWGVNQNRKH